LSSPRWRRPGNVRGIDTHKAQVLARVKTLTVQTVGPVLKTRDVIEKFDFDAQIGRLDRANLYTSSSRR
jgi:hypothetical protein